MSTYTFRGSCLEQHCRPKALETEALCRVPLNHEGPHLAHTSGTRFVRAWLNILAF
jgi:hypothetical protein